MTPGFVVASLVAAVLMCVAVMVLLHERATLLAADLAAEKAKSRRLEGQVMLARLQLARAVEHPSASVLPFERRTR